MAASRPSWTVIASMFSPCRASSGASRNRTWSRLDFSAMPIDAAATVNGTTARAARAERPFLCERADAQQRGADHEAREHPRRIASVEDDLASDLAQPLPLCRSYCQSLRGRNVLHLVQGDKAGQKRSNADQYSGDGGGRSVHAPGEPGHQHEEPGGQHEHRRSVDLSAHDPRVETRARCPARSRAAPQLRPGARTACS